MDHNSYPPTYLSREVIMPPSDPPPPSNYATLPPPHNHHASPPLLSPPPFHMHPTAAAPPAPDRSYGSYTREYVHIADDTFEIEAVNLCYRVPAQRSPAGSWPAPLLQRLMATKCSRRRKRAPPSLDDEIEKEDKRIRSSTDGHDVDDDAEEQDHDSSRWILRNVSFRALAGEILAIAGPSGAGKSTLLEVVAGKRKPTSGAASILVNRKPMEAAVFRRVSGYIPQTDALFPLLTVRETLHFSAATRLGGGGVAVAEKVAALLAELRLEHVAEAYVGYGGRGGGLSGGERRRVSIGVDAVHNPAVLLLDEPTSGLDSASALHVVEMLHAMAKTRSRTIILTIHQPGYRIMQLIHSFLVLAFGGRVAHHGSLPSMQFQLLAAGHRIPAHVNVLEYAIESVSAHHPNLPHPHLNVNRHGGFGGNHTTAAAAIKSNSNVESSYERRNNTTTDSESNRIVYKTMTASAMTRVISDVRSTNPAQTLAAFLMSAAEQGVESSLRMGSSRVSADSSSTNVEHAPWSATLGAVRMVGGDRTASGRENWGHQSKPAFACGRVREVALLSARFARNVLRSRQLLFVRSMQSLVAGVALGTLYIDIGCSERGVADRLGLFAFTLTFLLSSTVEALPMFLEERRVVMRETSRGGYRVSSYVLANVAIFIPYLLWLALLFCVPLYWLVGLNPSPSAFAFFAVTVWSVLLTANSFVAFMGALLPDYITGNSVISGSMGAFFLFSGYFIDKHDMPRYWQFMHYISLFKYPLDALLINEYSSSASPKCTCFAAAALLPEDDDRLCSVTPHDVLRQLGLDETSKWTTLLIVLSFVCFYRLLCYVVLRVQVARTHN